MIFKTIKMWFLSSGKCHFRPLATRPDSISEKFGIWPFLVNWSIQKWSITWTVLFNNLYTVILIIYTVLKLNYDLLNLLIERLGVCLGLQKFLNLKSIGGSEWCWLICLTKLSLFSRLIKINLLHPGIQKPYCNTIIEYCYWWVRFPSTSWPRKSLIFDAIDN